jgi:hypothetical protein
MTILIDNKEINAVQYACELNDLGHRIIPASDNISSVIIRFRNGKDIDNLTAYYIGRLIKEKMELDASIGRLERLPTPNMPNNVVVLVEPIEDLP